MKSLFALLPFLLASCAGAPNTKPSAKTQAAPVTAESYRKALSWLPEFIHVAADHGCVPGVINGDSIKLKIRSEETLGYLEKKQPPYWFIFHLIKDNDSSQSVYTYLLRQDTAQAPWRMRAAWRTDKHGVRYVYPASQIQPPPQTTSAKPPVAVHAHTDVKPGRRNSTPAFAEASQLLREMQYKGTAPGLQPDEKITVQHPDAGIHPGFIHNQRPPYIPLTITKDGDGTFLQYLFVRNATGSWKLGSAWTISAAGNLTELKVPAGQDLIANNAQQFTAPYMTEILALCAVSAGMDEPPDQAWLEFHPNGTGGLDYSTPDLLKHYQQLPQKRKQKGIIIFGSLTHLQDPEQARPKMTPFQWKCYRRASWLKAKQAFVEELAQACDKAKVPLWINTNLGGQDITYTRLSPRH